MNSFKEDHEESILHFRSSIFIYMELKRVLTFSNKVHFIIDEYIEIIL